MRTRVRFAIFALLAVIAAPTFAAGQADQPAAAEQDDPERNGLRWRNRPSFQFGDSGWTSGSRRNSTGGPSIPRLAKTTFERQQVRGGINAENGNHFEFQIEHDLYGSGTHCEVELDDLEDDECLFGGRWRDVFVRWRTFRQAEVTAGPLQGAVRARGAD